MPSIWDGVDRPKFEQDLADLHRIAPYQQVPRVALSPSRTPVDGQTEFNLPASIEKQLATDFAFLASWQPTPRCVAAVTVDSTDVLGHGLVITLAANEGVAKQVQESFQRLFGLLRSCASRSGLEILVELHQNRILGRLGSVNFCKVKGWQDRKLVHVGTRTRCLAESTILKPHVDSGSEDARVFVDQLNYLAKSADVMDNRPSGRAPAELKAVVHAAYAVSLNGVSLIPRLQRLGFPPETMSRVEVRQIQNLANYWRICESIAVVARSHRRCFERLQLHILDHGPPEEWPPKSRMKHFVHAEIQLLVHHQKSESPYPPRFVGTSKKACFLCYHFLQAHGSFAVAETHGEVHREWTVPDSSDYTTQVRNRLTDALQKLALKVSAALLANKSGTKQLAQPMQSAINLNILHLYAPSTSTLRSLTRINNQIVEGASNGTASIPEAQLEIASPMTHPLLQQTSSSSGTGSHETLVAIDNSRKPTLVSTRAAYVRSHGLELFINYERVSVDPKSDRVSCTLESISDFSIESSPYVDLTAMAAGDEVTLAAGDEQGISTFDVQYGGRKSKVEIVWCRMNKPPL
ncbi:hypothetical protein LTR97_009491 [Elasticomyces elasticus]|uniref:Uncharacterized protein n=1 Tax=Elasticomyces elasticus TaxID=574655 RepID=A0AAN7VPJ3_9PEZI|nr:hypothetical protein LTR97_009491 [Elasticomyces elasticus]